METPWSRVSDRKLPAFKWLHIFLHVSDEKYETLTVVSGYKVYMKLRIRKVARRDFMQYKCIAKNALGNSDGAITLYRKTNTQEHLIIVHALSKWVISFTCWAFKLILKTFNWFTRCCTIIRYSIWILHQVVPNFLTWLQRILRLSSGKIYRICN